MMSVHAAHIAQARRQVAVCHHCEFDCIVRLVLRKCLGGADGSDEWQCAELRGMERVVLVGCALERA